MIIMALLELIFAVMQVLFGWLMLPDMPITISNYLKETLDYIVDALPLLWVFVDKEVATSCFIVALACFNFEKLYYFLMWILRKLKLS